MSSDSEHIRSERDGDVGIITIDRRQRFGSLDVRTARDLRRAGLKMARDEAVRAVVLRGSGGIFCSGADLKYIRAGGDAGDLSYLHPEARAVPAGPGEIFKQILNISTAPSARSAARPSRSSPRSRAWPRPGDWGWRCHATWW